MTSPKKNDVTPDKNLVTVCGLFCPACMVYLAPRISPEKHAQLAKSRGIPAEELHCDGCRTQNRFSYCKSCKFVPCAASKGIDFCGQCGEYPCEDLKAFQAQMPHRIELWQAHARIKEVGWEQWFKEMLEHYSCQKCGTLNAIYFPSCHECGAEPSNAYVAEHGEAIKTFLAKRAQEKLK